MKAIDLRRQQAVDSDPKAINFTGNPTRDVNTILFSLLKKPKKRF